MTSHTLPRALIIKSKKDISTIIRTGNRLSTEAVRIRYQTNTASHPRLAISIGRKYGNAVARNRFKRLVREAFRHIRQELPQWDILIMPQPETIPGLTEMTGAFERLAAAGRK